MILELEYENEEFKAAGEFWHGMLPHIGIGIVDIGFLMKHVPLVSSLKPYGTQSALCNLDYEIVENSYNFLNRMSSKALMREWYDWYDHLYTVSSIPGFCVTHKVTL